MTDPERAQRLVHIFRETEFELENSPVFRRLAIWVVHAVTYRRLAPARGVVTSANQSQSSAVRTVGEVLDRGFGSRDTPNFEDGCDEFGRAVAEAVDDWFARQDLSGAGLTAIVREEFQQEMAETGLSGFLWEERFRSLVLQDLLTRFGDQSEEVELNLSIDRLFAAVESDRARELATAFLLLLVPRFSGLTCEGKPGRAPALALVQEAIVEFGPLGREAALFALARLPAGLMSLSVRDYVARQLKR